MRCLCLSVVLLTSLSMIAPTHGQQPTPARPEAKPGETLVDIPTTSMTPEMWLYLHEQKREDDPAHAVRRRAELKAAQREQRLASSKWYGFYNARPSASMVPIMGTYSPSWVGNGWNNYQWISTGRTATNFNYIRVEQAESRR